MEILIEFVMELILGGGFEVAQDKDIPRWIKIIVLTVLSLFYLGFIILFIIMSVRSKQLILRGITIILGVVFVSLFIRLWYKGLKSSRN